MRCPLQVTRSLPEYRLGALATAVASAAVARLQVSMGCGAIDRQVQATPAVVAIVGTAVLRRVGEAVADERSDPRDEVRVRLLSRLWGAHRLGPQLVASARVRAAASFSAAVVSCDAMITRSGVWAFMVWTWAKLARSAVALQRLAGEDDCSDRGETAH